MGGAVDLVEFRRRREEAPDDPRVRRIGHGLVLAGHPELHRHVHLCEAGRLEGEAEARSRYDGRGDAGLANPLRRSCAGRLRSHELADEFRARGAMGRGMGEIGRAADGNQRRRRPGGEAEKTDGARIEPFAV